MNDEQWRKKQDEKVLEVLKLKKKAEDLKYAAKYPQRSGSQ